MLVPTVVVEVDEILNVVVGADVLNVLLPTCDGHAHHLIQTRCNEGLDWCAILHEGENKQFNLVQMPSLMENLEIQNVWYVLLEH